MGIQRGVVSEVQAPDHRDANELCPGSAEAVGSAARGATAEVQLMPRALQRSSRPLPQTIGPGEVRRLPRVAEGVRRNLLRQLCTPRSDSEQLCITPITLHHSYHGPSLSILHVLSLCVLP